MNTDNPMPKTFVEMQESTRAEIVRQRELLNAQRDAVNNPEWYTSHPSGVSCIDVTEHMSFCLGNVIKYVWRSDLKGGVEDLKKARWYIDREIKRREAKVVDEAPVSQS